MSKGYWKYGRMDKLKFKGREGWYKFKKPREERVRSHYEEREEDILANLEHIQAQKSHF